MDYYEGIIRNTEFFTTTELAKKLKMNVQVITRKIQSGQIEAYKIGKDWRIPEPSVHAWLEQLSNKQDSLAAELPDEVLDIAATDTHSHSTVDRRADQLGYILAMLEPNRNYTETEIDSVIKRCDADYESVRRLLLDEKMLVRDNGHYRRCEGWRLAR